MESVVRDVRTARFWRIFGAQAFASFGLSAAVAGDLVLFWPDLFKDQGWIALVVVLISLLYGGWRAWPRPIQTKYGSPETLIRLVRGDLFEQQDAHLIVDVGDTLWNAVRVGSNGRKVRMPMIGGGLSKLSPVLPADQGDRFAVAGLDGTHRLTVRAHFTPTATIYGCRRAFRPLPTTIGHAKQPHRHK